MKYQVGDKVLFRNKVHEVVAVAGTSKFREVLDKPSDYMIAHNGSVHAVSEYQIQGVINDSTDGLKKFQVSATIQGTYTEFVYATTEKDALGKFEASLNCIPDVEIGRNYISNITYHMLLNDTKVTKLEGDS